MFCAVAHGAQFNLCRTRRNADYHTQRRGEEAAARVYHFDESAHHLFASGEVGYDSIAEWANGSDVVVSLLIHHLCLRADSNHFVCATVECHYRRFINNNLVVADDDGVGSAEVHRNFLSE